MKQNYNRKNAKVWRLHLWAITLLTVFAGIASAQLSYTFTPCGATGSIGPTQTQVNNSYTNTSLMGLVTTMTNGIQTWTVPFTGNYRIEARGAQGGTSTSTGGLGATMIGDFTLTVGEVIQILVGQQGEHGLSSVSPGGGGGGSYVVRTPYNATTAVLVVAGGGTGGGAYTDNPGLTTNTGGTGGVSGGSGGSGGDGGTRGAGGGGFLSDGGQCTASTTYASPGIGYVNGGFGGFRPNNTTCTSTFASIIAAGGFGGGASHGGNCFLNGGAGGGFSGGGGSSNSSAGGGGSLNQGTNQSNTSGNNAGDGRVIITPLCNVQAFASGSSSTAPMICSGQSLTLTTNAVSNFSWSTGATTNSIVIAPTTNTVYSITGTSSLNCGATGIIGITVSSGLPVLSISNPSNNICLGKTVSLTATGALSYTWTNPGVVNGQTFTPSSTAVYTVTGKNGCGTSVATTTITVAPLSVTTLASPTLVCQGSPSTLTAVSAATNFTWLPSSSGGGSSVIVAPTANTIYTVTASDGTCSGTQTVSVATKITPTLNVSTSAATICEGQQAVLTASGANTYTWGPGNLSGSSITVTPNQTSLYTVIGENSVGCFDTDQQVVIVNSSPTLNITASKLTICTGQSVTLNASGGSSYLWTGGPPTSSNVVTPLATTVYTVTGSQTSNTCTAEKSITISVVVPNLTLPTNTQVCSGKSVTVTASGADVYVWNSISTGSVGMFVLQPTATGPVTLVATTKSLNINCPVTHTFNVTVNALPVLTVTATKSVVCKNQTNTLTVTGAQNYNWTSTITGSTIVITPSANITYTVLGTDANGCESIGSHQAKTSSCAGIDEMSLSGNQLAVYPNPNKGTFTIKAESSMDLILINELGQELKKFKLEETNNYTYEFKDLKPGIYFMQDASNAGVIKQKIVVN